MWTYKSHGLSMEIHEKDHRFVLEISDEIYGSYSSPGLAADDVAVFSTGCYDWDKYDGKITDYPLDLSEWNHTS